MLTREMIRELQQIEQENDGHVPVNAIIVIARNPESALHHFPAFRWDPQQAAEAHWYQAATAVARAYVTVIDRGDGDRVRARGYVSVRNRTGQRAYRRTVEVIKSDRPEMIENILDRIAGIINSYPLTEFDPILAAIEQVRDSLQTPAPKRRGRPRGGERAEARA